MTDEEFLEYYKEVKQRVDQPSGVMIPTSLLDKMLDALEFYADKNRPQYPTAGGERARKILNIE